MAENYTCASCSGAIAPFMSFGQQPISQALREPDTTTPEYLFELAPALCAACGLVQIVDHPAPAQMFNADYPFFSSSSRFMTLHFATFAADLIAARPALADDGLVVEIGSNDGTLLGNFARAGVRHLGVEPSAGIAAVARANGVATRIDFFDAASAANIRAEHGPADLIVATNAIAHIGALDEVAAGVAALLATDGLFVFEAVYLGDVVRNTAFDQIYDEHIFTFSALAVANAYARHGLELIDTAPQPVHGGSMRYTLAPTGHRAADPRVAATIAADQHDGLADPATYTAFAARCAAVRDALAGLVGGLVADGHTVVGYGATAKSATLLNYCQFSPTTLAYIQDSTPEKHGKLTPGTHIPIRPPAEFRADAPDYALLLAWNHRAEIEAKEAAWRAGGGKWVLYVPEVGTA